MVGVLADDVKERICGCSFSEGVVQCAFEVLRELKGTNIEGSGGLVRERVTVNDCGVREREVIIRGYMV